MPDRCLIAGRPGSEGDYWAPHSVNLLHVLRYRSNRIIVVSDDTLWRSKTVFV